MNSSRTYACALLASVALAGCASSNGSSRCVPGQQSECACERGYPGIQECAPDGTYLACDCGDDWSSSSSAGDAGSDSRGNSSGLPGFGASGGDASTDSGGALDAGTPSSGEVLAQSASNNLIDVFVRNADVWVVDSAGVSRLSLADGTTDAHYAAPRPVTAAAFDGSLLVLADGAKLATLDPEALTLKIDGPVIEGCAVGALMSGSRFVCGPSNDWDRIFYTYDATTAKLMASSAKYTYHGIPMRKVPGLDEFVTVSVGTSPSDFYLYRLAATGEVQYVSETPYHGDFAASMAFAFDADPATHLITEQGVMLRFDDSVCTEMSAPYGSGTCLAKDGALGVLTGAQRFVAMDNVASTLYGLLDPGSSGAYYGATHCSQSACVLEKVDVPSRTISSQQVVRLSIGKVIAMRAVPDQAAVVIGFSSAAGYPSSMTPSGYQVVRLDLE